MMNRRTFQLALSAAVIAAMLGMSGCSKEEPAQAQTQAPSASQDLLDQIRAKGEIVIATEGTWSPWTFHDKEGKLTGYDIEVGRLIAQKLGVKPQFVDDVVTLALARMEEQGDGAEFKTVIGEMKTKYATWFGGAEDPSESKGQKGTGSSIRSESGSNASKKEDGIGKRLAAQRKPNRKNFSYWDSNK